MRTLAWCGIALTVAVVLYTAPVVRLWHATGRALPPWVSADTYLYLNLARLSPDANGEVQNPWYGNRVPVEQVSYLRFGLPFRLFHALTVVTGDDGAALVAWHALMAIAIGGTLLWMLRPLTSDPLLLLWAFATLMIVDAFYAWADLSQMRTGTWRWVFGLPYARTFYPQVGVPLIFASIGAIERWLADHRRRWLALIALLQFIAFVSFPFAAVLIAGGMLGAVAAAMLLRASTWRDARAGTLMVIAAIGLDALWFMMRGGWVNVPGASGLIHVDLSQLHVTRTITLPLAFGCIVLCARGVGRNIRAAFAGFSVAFALMQLADVVLTPALLLGTHIAYFYTIAFWLPLIAVALAVAARIRPGLTHAIAAAGTAAVVVFGILEARATAQVWWSYNVDNGQLARALDGLALTAEDVVVVPTHGFRSGRNKGYWEASWVPLVSAATVLYSAHGKLLLPAGSSEESERLATYLFLRGEDASRLDALLAAPATTGEQAFLVGYGRELFLMSGARQQTLSDVRRELGPHLDALARGESPRFLTSARRVIVADYRDDPELRVERASQVLAVDRVWDVGEWRILVGHPRK